MDRAGADPREGWRDVLFAEPRRGLSWCAGPAARVGWSIGAGSACRSWSENGFSCGFSCTSGASATKACSGGGLCTRVAINGASGSTSNRTVARWWHCIGRSGGRSCRVCGRFKVSNVRARSGCDGATGGAICAGAPRSRAKARAATSHSGGPACCDRQDHTCATSADAAARAAALRC